MIMSLETLSAKKHLKQEKTDRPVSSNASVFASDLKALSTSARTKKKKKSAKGKLSWNERLRTQKAASFRRVWDPNSTAVTQNQTFFGMSSV